MNQSMQTPLLDASILIGGNSVLGKKSTRFRGRQSPLASSKEIVAKYFDKDSGAKKSFTWRRPINMSMDQKTINRLIEARRCMEIPQKEAPKHESKKKLDKINVEEVKQ